MRITPLDVRKQEFDRSLRGLDPDEVHAFLATVADEYEAVLTDNKQLREKVIELDQKVAEYRNMERTLRDTLLTAERVMNDARQNARKEAENILREAEVKAREATSDIQNQVDALRAQMRELRGQRDGFMARLQSLAEAQIGLTQSYRSDFKDDDARTERLMRAPETRAPQAPAVPDPTTEASTTEIAPAQTPHEPTVDVTPPPVSGPTSGPVAPITHSSADEDAWKSYDLAVGSAPATPTPAPATNTPPAEAMTPPPPVDAAPVFDVPMTETVVAETLPEPPVESSYDAPETTTEDPQLIHAMDEVTEAVDSALEDSGPVMPVATITDATPIDPAAEPDSPPADGAESVETPLAHAEAAGQNPDTLTTPDLPDPTGETPVEPTEGDGSNRWSLSRFTKGLSSF